ncbi:hypothetical protein JQX13_30465 [Archangium violaceum]|uniref:hypothetical protein n=1 Tax=Archangium violaceum TaxID=83451 RepID=UPI00193B4FCC|nr:hypothetical protein [Archangium violaceum]QRK04563.1 hypothetical protein JQX13_30465 [Archangium violaceum]
MTKKIVGLFASVALVSSGLALANDDKSKSQQTQSSQQMGGGATGGSGSQQGQMGEKQITGTVVKSGSNKLSLRTDNGIIDFKVDKQTRFQDPNVKQLRDINEGQQVRTSFTVEKDSNVAKSISLDTSMGGSGLDSDTGINQDMGGSGLDQGVDKDMGGAGDVGGDVGGSGSMGGDVGGTSGDQGGIH